jgi:hypothetical protein
VDEAKSEVYFGLWSVDLKLGGLPDLASMFRHVEKFIHVLQFYFLSLFTIALLWCLKWRVFHL